jgi:hypothetical protein
MTMMSHLARMMQRAAVCLLVLAALVLALGVWGQMQKARLDADRADAMLMQVPAGFDSVPVPFILQPFEAHQVPGFVAGDRSTVFGVFARIGGALGLLGIVLLSIRAVRIPRSEDAEDAEVDADVEPPTMAQMQATPTADWQRRLADKMAARTAAPTRSAAASSSHKPGKSFALFVVAILGFGAMVLGATTFLLPSEPLAMPDMAALLDQSIMTVKADLYGDKILLLGAIKVIAVLCGVFVLLRLILSRRRSASGEDRIAAH